MIDVAVEVALAARLVLQEEPRHFAAQAMGEVCPTDSRRLECWRRSKRFAELRHWSSDEVEVAAVGDVETREVEG